MFQIFKSFSTFSIPRYSRVEHNQLQLQQIEDIEILLK